MLYGIFQGKPANGVCDQMGIEGGATKDFNGSAGGEMSHAARSLHRLTQELVLLEAVGSGKVEEARKIFDKMFWQGTPVRPDWSMVRSALVKENKPMLRLLAAHGAKIDGAGLEALKKENAGKFAIYENLLRKSGIGRAFEEKQASSVPADERPHVTDSMLKDEIPQEWRNVLRVTQEDGGREAVIAGGALRDLFNKRAVKDVDIFLRSRGGPWRNKRLLEGIFKRAGLHVKKKFVGLDDYGLTVYKQFPPPKTGAFTRDTGTAYPETIGTAESWEITAGPRGTVYNFIFLDGPLSRQLAEESPKALMETFDIGLCRIAFDGEKVIRTEEYKKDAREKTITLLQANASSQEHLHRIAEKYPDFALDQNAQALQDTGRGKNMKTNSIIFDY